jgi:hypothetical protein
MSQSPCVLSWGHDAIVPGVRSDFLELLNTIGIITDPHFALTRWLPQGYGFLMGNRDCLLVYS